MSERVLRFDRPPHLPPPSVAPILKFYDPELQRVGDEARLEAPTDERGVVDIPATIKLAMSLVDPDYVWPRDKCDVHHFVWPRAVYLPDVWQDKDRIAQRYREDPTRKGYIPRQVHEFLHATIAPPGVAEYSVMKECVEHSNAKIGLFNAARTAIGFDRHPGSVVRGAAALDEAILHKVLSNILDNFTHQQLKLPSDSEFVEIASSQVEHVARSLGRAAAKDSISLMHMIYANRKSAKLVTA